MTLRTRSANLGGTVINTNAIVLATGVDLSSQINAAFTQANSAYEQANTGSAPKINSIVYPGDDQAANTAGGQTVYLVGSGFASNATVYINGNSVPSVTYISAGNLSISTPALATGTYPVYVINPDDGATAIRVPGLIVSGEPTWNTAAGSLNAGQTADGPWSYTLSATGDAPITYTLAAGSSLPTGVTLNANGVVSGTISSPPASDTTYTFSVVASDAQNQDSTRQFSVTATVSDVYFANTVLLLHADGTNNANNHAFVDSSTNNFTINRNGNATQGSFSPFSQTGWSNYFDGNGDYLQTPSTVSSSLGTSNFTFECWIYRNAVTDVTYADAICCVSTGTAGFAVGVNPDGKVGYAISSAGVWDVRRGVDPGDPRGSIVIPLNAWTHIALVRNGSTFTGYVNGVQDQTFTSSASISSISANYNIGKWHDANNRWWNGYISNFRFVIGTAVYTSAFTPPTEPLTAITNTSLLTCQSNRFIDKSTNNFTVTRNGDVSVQAFSPFRPTDPYVAANVAGSLYVDGTSDNINVASNTAFAFGTDPFTVEMWYYPTAAPDQWDSIFSTGGTSGIFFACRSGFLDWTNNNDNAGTIRSNWPTIGQWNHIVLTQGSGTRAVFINGVRTGNTASGFSWGQDGMTFADNTIGYYSGFRIIKGQAIYDPTQTTLTVPTAPPTTTSQGSTNTVFLCNFTNAQIFDQAAKNVLATVGDAKVSTAQYKYGSGSIAFDGTGDYLVGQITQHTVFNTDFTVEFWCYKNVDKNYNLYFDNRATVASATGFSIASDSAGKFGLFTNNAFAILSAGAYATSTWHHVAAVRFGSTITLYVNGVSVGSVSNSTAFTDGRLAIGISLPDVDHSLNGYIDDVRVTRNFARYTSNFTPPNSAFPNK